MKRIVIAAPKSGSGKTTLTLGLMAALKKRGLRVAPFKVGPDFIDPGHHRMVTGTPSVNLDGWICPATFIEETFSLWAAEAEIAVIEGVMGLFDGIGSSDAGSTAEIAKLVGAPVILVLDAAGQGRSAAAVLHGFAGFDPGIRLSGVVFNNVASENHGRILAEAMAAATPGIKLLGCVPRDAALALPSRHLGLVTAEENPLSGEFLAHLVQVVERHLDLEAILALAVGVDTQKSQRAPVHSTSPGAPAEVRIAVARDAAFCFMYQDNLRLMRESGAELCFFSPLEDQPLPEGISGIYLPGGYPELFAARLASNRLPKEGIRRGIEEGMPVYAECGGFIYLTEGVVAEGDCHPMVGIFPVLTRMLPRRKALGYREVRFLEDSLLGAAGTVARGHEFHYSEMDQMPAEVERVYAVGRNGVPLGEEGYRRKNCLASYIHLHFGSSPALAENFVQNCRSYRRGSLT